MVEALQSADCDPRSMKGLNAMLWIWLGFILLLAALLALDLGVLHRKSHAIGLREAMVSSAAWVAVALAFTGLVYVGYQQHWMGLGTSPDAVDGSAQITGGAAAVKFLTAYVIEKSLSVDNLFVIAVIFASLRVPAREQHRVLFWGIVGALAMRAVMIVAGAALVARYHWLFYPFGALLIVAAVRLLLAKEHAPPAAGAAAAAVREGWAVRLARRWLPVSPEFDGGRFVTRLASSSRWALTPLGLSLIAVESADAVFAADSIPAVLAVTADPFLVFTSNAFALLGLRSLYFALAAMMTRFRYLKVSLAGILALVGAKMIAGDALSHVLGDGNRLWLPLAVVVLLAGGVVASLVRREDAPSLPDLSSPPRPAPPAGIC
jgi:tellurite resistance protein TerC